MTPISPPDPRRAQLRRLKLIALAMLLAMLAGFVISHLQGERGIWAWVSAFCEAAAVGALADWFAVVALFRRPLGLPIPHTAIIPRSKERIADSLALFVRDQFLEPQALLARLQVFDPASRLGSWLADPARSRLLADMARGWALQALDFLDEAAVRRSIQGFVIQQLRRWNAAATAGELLGLLTADNRHQRVLDEGLTRVGQWLDNPSVKQRASELIVRYLQREWPKLASTVNWVKPIDEIGDSLAERMAHAVLAELQQILAEPAHPLRRDYETWLANYIQRLRGDPALAEKIDQIKQQVIDHPAVQEYVQGLWERIHASLRADLSSVDSALAGHLRRSLAAVGQALQDDPSLRQALNQHLMDGAERLTSRLREGVTTHIAQTVKGWDERHLVEQLELSVGRDLQFIRFNGTLVGGLIGLLLHALTVWMHW
ncbi:DUF445 domain-containing protein [Stenotrophomonas rhizophila]|uniref:DUF445 domain-containing protein n=1 Tax=Stenotrophomonas rhizophila TaxID=216778 RepID=UPI001E4E0924|nr:DUF445 family protein [Stenotrophomonas rhizophila]MCC7634951.1 DUF445 family protein [Stenotrophomonas rhizophila]MCC7664266.1 DUF445 family protein [Stenotrophomonas rhizophila]